MLKDNSKCKFQMKVRVRGLVSSEINKQSDLQQVDLSWPQK